MEKINLLLLHSVVSSDTHSSLVALYFEVNLPWILCGS